MMSTNHLTRRPFLRAAAATALVAGVSRPSWAASLASPYAKTLGLQLYTLRNQMAQAPSATLRAVKEAGYDQVELMDVMDADGLVPLAKEHGLRVTSAFIQWEILGNAQPKDRPTINAVIEKAAKHQLKYLVFGYVGKGHRETVAQYQSMADRSNAAGEQMKKAGIQLCYHHHSFEFAPLEGKSTTGMDVLVERFDKQLAQFEIDVFWAAIGGVEPVGLLEKLDGRVAQVHLKDLLSGTPTIHDEGKVPKEAFKEVGAGTIDMAKVLAASQKIGVAQCHVEQDQSPEPLDSIRLSAKNLQG